MAFLLFGCGVHVAVQKLVNVLGKIVKLLLVTTPDMFQQDVLSAGRIVTVNTGKCRFLVAFVAQMSI